MSSGDTTGHSVQFLRQEWGFKSCSCSQRRGLYNAKRCFRRISRPYMFTHQINSIVQSKQQQVHFEGSIDRGAHDDSHGYVCEIRTMMTERMLGNTLDGPRERTQEDSQPCIRIITISIYRGIVGIFLQPNVGVAKVQTDVVDS